MNMDMAGGREAVARKVELRPLSGLKPAKRNARTHSDRQIEQIAASIRNFGFNSPVLVDGEGTIIAGHGRRLAAMRLGMSEVPVIQIEHLTPEELVAYRIADNRIAQNAGWDEDILKMDFSELQMADAGFEMELTGFNTTQIDLILDGKPAKADTEALPELDPRKGRAVEAGDLWILGDHRLFCGSALERANYVALMGEEKARMVFSDPPYNVRIDGHVCGLGRIRHAEFRMASGEMSPAQFTGFQADAYRNLAEFSINGAIHYLCMDWRHMQEMLEAGHSVYSELKNLCIWSKDNGGMGAFYRSQHELVFVWKVGTEPHLNTIELGRNGRYRTNIWEYPGASKTGMDADLAMHPTVKPVPMIMDAIKDTSKRHEIVLDCFGGSGSTLIAAEKTRRRARLIELEPDYCEVTIRRWEKLTGKKAILEATGEAFTDVATRRHEELERACDAALEEKAA